MGEDLTNKVEEAYNPQFQEGDILVAKSAEELALGLPSMYLGLIPGLEGMKPVVVIKSCVFDSAKSGKNCAQYNIGIHTQDITNWIEWMSGEEEALYDGIEEEMNIMIPEDKIDDFLIKSPAKTIDEAVKLYDDRVPSCEDMKKAYNQGKQIEKELQKAASYFMKKLSKD